MVRATSRQFESLANAKAARAIDLRVRHQFEAPAGIAVTTARKSVKVAGIKPEK
jgi:hypothetical protein